MSKAERNEQRIQKRISAITCGAQVVGMTALSLKVLTNDFEEKYVQQLIGKGESPDDQRIIFDAIEKAFDEVHYVDEDFGRPVYDKEVPDYFEQYRLDLELGVVITDTDEDIPTSAADPKFDDLCKSLVQQRAWFEQITTSMSDFMEKVEKGDSTYKKISALVKENEAKTRECDELRERNKELTVQLDEAQKMNKKLAEKSDDNVVVRIIRQYLNQSKKKSTSKKENIKIIIEEVVRSAGIVLPDDVKATLDTFDNETPAQIDKVEIYEEGSTKNENCKQVSIAPAQTALAAAISYQNPFPVCDADNLPF